MWAAETGQWEVCLKLAELEADLNKADKVSETCCNRMSVRLLYHCDAHLLLLTRMEGQP